MPLIYDGNNTCYNTSIVVWKSSCDFCHYICCEEFDISLIDFDNTWIEILGFVIF